VKVFGAKSLEEQRTDPMIIFIDIPNIALLESSQVYRKIIGELRLEKKMKMVG
jgi:hypothetical protein